MARHRLSPKRVPFLARSRRPALLGGALGGGAALVIGLVTCAVLSTTSVGVRFAFVDRAEAAVIGSTPHEPEVTRDLATAPSATPRPTPTASAVARQVAPAPRAVATATPTTTPDSTAAAAPAAVAAPAATPSSSPSPTPSSSSSPSSSPTAPAQSPSPQPTNPVTGDPVDCVLVIICY